MECLIEQLRLLSFFYGEKIKISYILLQRSKKYVREAVVAMSFTASYLHITTPLSDHSSGP